MERKAPNSTHEPLEHLFAAIVDAALKEPGNSHLSVRHSAFDLAAQIGGRSGQAQQMGEPLPENLRRFVEKEARHAYRITDRDVAELLRSGFSEDAVFEVIVAAAVGAGLARLERGLAALAEATGGTEAGT